MSVDYAAGLSHYDDLGVCGLDEVPEKIDSVKAKVKQLAEWLRKFDGSCVVHVGAGLSTSAGIPDFRGKSGVWTKLLKGDHPNIAVEPSIGQDVKIESKLEKDQETIKPFDETQPTVSHLILRELCLKGHVDYIISQNVDGLFLKSNLPRKFISELHGDFFLDECTRCRSRFIRGTASKTMRLQRSMNSCPRTNPPCKGKLRDTILDWESPVPHNELRLAQAKSKRNKLHICIGTTMQLRPAKDLVCNPKKQKSTKLVIINLQPTQNDKLADLVINYYADDVMTVLAEELDLKVSFYNREEDPTKNTNIVGTQWLKDKNKLTVSLESTQDGLSENQLEPSA